MIMRSLDWKVHWYCGDLGDIESLVEELRLPSHKKYSPLKVFFPLNLGWLYISGFPLQFF